MDKIAVISINKQQFDYFLKEVDPDDRVRFVYIDTPEKVYGQEFISVIRVGEYYRKSMWQDLYKLALIRIK